MFIAKFENNCIRYGIDKADLPTILRASAEYLEKEQYLFIHPSEIPKRKTLSKNCFKQLLKEFKKKYPKRKPIEYPKSQYLTKKLEKLFDEFNIEIVLTKSSAKKRREKWNFIM